jgi:hypothetical protein
VLQCKYCGHSCSKLAKAHIIPRSFYKVVRGSDKYSVELKVKENYEKQEYWQSGIHDSNIVCESCEKLFNPFDTHGYAVLSATLSQKKVCYGSDRQPYAYLIENADYHKLKLFFLSMLWRAHASSLIFFSHVNLGSHESIFRSYISTGKAPLSDEYEIVLFHLINQPHPPGIIPPWKHKADGVNVYRFYLPGLIALIKVDKRPLPKLFKSIVLRESPPHRLIFLPYLDSSEMRYVEKMKSFLQLDTED